MQNSFTPQNRPGLWIGFIFTALLAVLVILPFQFTSKAGSDDSAAPKTASQEKNLEDYDIRQDESKEATADLLDFRQRNGRDAVIIADLKDEFVAGETALRQTVPTLKIEYNKEIETPGLIAPDVEKGSAFLTAPSSAKRSDILRNFIKTNNRIVGMSDAQVSNLKVTADYTNPDNTLSFATMEQFINGIPVFRGETKAGFTTRGEMINVVNNLAAGLDYENLSREFGDPANAVRVAAQNVEYELKDSDTVQNDAASTALKIRFGAGGDWDVTAEKMYFPLEPGVAVPVWRVLIWKPVNAYYVLVEAETGKMLMRENITKDQTQAATFNVYANTTSMLKTLDNPAPLSPGPTDPASGTQGAIVNRTNVSLVGNEAPYTFNNLGWITDDANSGNGWTDGNAVQAGIDRDGVNGVDAPAPGTNRVFNFAYNPAPGNPAPGDAPIIPDFQKGASTQLFYTCNRFHDELYLLGFTEAAKNFQNDNFGRGGAAGDRVSAEAQDSSGTNNANFATPADGGRGRMQMYIWTPTTPDRDGDLDAEIVVHEHTHGLVARLHTAISGTQGGQMHEGYADWYGHALLSEPTDPLMGTYTTGGYSTLLLRSATFTSNYYYGIRHFPKAIKAFTGPNGKPHNPLTFADIDPAQDDITDGAYPAPFGWNPTAVHDGGEVWSSALWEVRAKLITRMGAAAGNQRVLQIATSGMKLAPSNPTMLQERNAILAAAQAIDGTGATTADTWAGFAIRGMGFGATNPSGNTVVESFALPNAEVATTGFSVSDPTPGGDGDGYPEPGETVQLTVPVTNNTGNTINNVVVTVTGGGTASYGSVANGATVTRDIAYTVPAGAACGSLHTVSMILSSDIGTQPAVTRSFRLGAPVGGAPATFSNTAAITINDNAAATPYPSDVIVAGLTGNKTIKLNLNGLTHTYPDDIDILLVGPGGQKFMAMSDLGGSGDVTNINLTLHDGATSILPAAQLTSGEFKPGNEDTTSDVMPAPAPAGPYSSPAPAGSATFASVFGSSGAAMNGTWSLYVRDDAATDFGLLTGGWSLTFEANDYSCAVGPTASTAFIGGRVILPTSGIVSGVKVTLTKPNGEVLNAKVRRDGAYRFDNLEVGQTYIVEAHSRTYQFSPQVIFLTENLDEVNFTPSQ